MKDIIQFGEEVEGYDIRVLNEREIRAAAGILFVMMFVAIQAAALKEDFLLIKYAVTIFLTDIVIRVFVNPRYAPSLIIGRLIVRNQVPEYVGAGQKKFAWIIGVILAGTMFLHLVVLNARGPIAGIICFICLVFLFFETAFGICLGCKLYPLVRREKPRYCPGEVCEPRARQEIQKTSAAQMLVVAGFALYIVLLALVMNDTFKKQTVDLFGLDKAAQSK